MKTKTRDTSAYGLPYLSGLLRLESKRNMAHIARETDVAEQNLQQFISDSPWSGQNPVDQVQAEVRERPEFQEGSMLLLDESAEVKSGETTAGGSRQHNGRLGKVENSQVGVFLSLVNNGHHLWIDGDLFLPERWFTPEYAAKRQRVGIPSERTFETKLAIGLRKIKQVRDNEVPFDAVDCDTLYGRSGWFRDQLAQEQIEYYADVPANIKVYRQRPQLHWPLTKRGTRAKKPEVSMTPISVADLALHATTVWQTITVRPNERGHLVADFARHQVWTIRPDGTLRAEWLIIRRDRQQKQTTYSLSNAPIDTPLAIMAQRKSQRYFIERSNQDAKSELGWDECQAIKYRAWEHHLAFTILASWFILETKLDWLRDHPPQTELLEAYQTDVLPTLSVANVRTLLRAVMPLPQLSPSDAIQLVIKHLDNRTRSRKSRLRKALST